MAPPVSTLLVPVHGHPLRVLRGSPVLPGVRRATSGGVVHTECRQEATFCDSVFEHADEVVLTAASKTYGGWERESCVLI